MENNDALNRLVDGSTPLQADALLQRLTEFGIEHATVRHTPVFTVEEARAQRNGSGGAHSKNLLLRNKKGRMWLLTCLEDRCVDLRQLADVLGAGRFSFASPRRLMAYLGITPGAVTPFGLINDITGAVQLVLDGALLGMSPLHFHPLDNSMTTAIRPDDLMRFLESIDHSPQVLSLWE